MKKLLNFVAFLFLINNFVPLFSNEEPKNQGVGHIVFSSVGNEDQDNKNKIALRITASQLHTAQSYVPIEIFINRSPLSKTVTNPQTCYVKAISLSMTQGNINLAKFPHQKLLDYKEIISKAQRENAQIQEDATFLAIISRDVQAELDKRDREIHNYMISLGSMTDQQLQTEFTALEAQIQTASRDIGVHETSKIAIQGNLTQVIVELDKYDKAYSVTNFIHDHSPFSTYTHSDYLKAKQKHEDQIKNEIKAQLELTTQLEQYTQKYLHAYHKMRLQQFLNDPTVSQDFQNKRIRALNEMYLNLGETKTVNFKIDANTTEYLENQGFKPNYLRKCNGNPLTNRLVSENIGIITYCAEQSQLHPEAKQLLDLVTTASVASSEAAKNCNFELAAGLNRGANILYFSYVAINGLAKGYLLDQIISVYTLTHHIGLRYIEEIRQELQGSTFLTAFGAVARGTGYATCDLLDEAFQETNSIKDMADDALEFLTRLSLNDRRAWRELKTTWQNFWKLPPEKIIGTTFELVGIIFSGKITKILTTKVEKINRIAELMRELNPISVAGRLLAYPEERHKILKKLEDLLKQGVKKDYGIENMLTKDSKIIFRKDFGKHGLPVSRGYKPGEKVDHYNIEIHVRQHQGSQIDKWDKKADYHIVVDKDGHATDFF